VGDGRGGGIEDVEAVVGDLLGVVVELTCLRLQGGGIITTTTHTKNNNAKSRTGGSTSPF
jgi:hypothetical protein